MNIIYNQKYDRKNIIISLSKLLFIISISIFISIKYFTIIMGSFFMLSVILILLLLYFQSSRKIVITQEQIILKKLLGTITLDLDYIGNIEKLNYKHIINLKSNTLSAYFSLFGKDDSYKSKRFENIKMISTSDKFNDNILIEYGIDYYILSVDRRDDFYDELKKLLPVKNDL